MNEIETAQHAAFLHVNALLEAARLCGAPVFERTALDAALATALLERNDDNRKVSDLVVANYARDITSGRWIENGQSIVVADDGQLNDGQHRCWAVLEARRAIDVLLVVGVRRDSRLTVDQGKIRVVGDYLEMEGHGDGKYLGAVAAYVWQWRTRTQLSNQALFRPTKAEITALVREEPGIAQSLASIPRRRTVPVGGVSLLGFCHFVFSSRATAKAADEFVAMLVEGSAMQAGHPVLYARNRLGAEGRRMSLNEKADLLFRAWNAWRQGKEVSRLQAMNTALPQVER